MPRYSGNKFRAPTNELGEFRGNKKTAAEDGDLTRYFA